MATFASLHNGVHVLKYDDDGDVSSGKQTRVKQLFKRTRTRVKEILADPEGWIGRDVTVCGWARTVRNQKTFAFMELSDGSGFKGLQIIITDGETEGFADTIKAGGTGSSFRIVGKVVKSPAKGQAVEVRAEAVHVLGTVDASKYPLSKKAHSVEFMRSVAHLRPRSNLIGAVSRVRNACAFATHSFFNQKGFLYVHTPIITGADCEGAGEMFSVTTLIEKNGANLPTVKGKPDEIDYSQDFFSKPASLTVSGQLNVECFSCALSDVYTFGPTFRAENSHTSRHLCEFWMIEPEIAFATLDDDMNLAEEYLKFCVQYVLDHCPDDIDFFEKRVEKGLRTRLTNVLENPFERLTYTRAIEILNEPKNLKRGKFEEKPEWGIDLGSEHERFLTEQVFKKPIILTHYPIDIKSFYMRQCDPDEKGRRTCEAMDVLVPKIGEIIGGSAREERLDVLESRIEELNLEAENFDWYTDLRRYGSVPHAGFGLGFERLVMFTTGVENIRDVIPFPRWPGNCSY